MVPRCNSPMLETAWRRLGAASDWESVGAQQAMLSDRAYQALLAEQPLFAGAAMVYGPRRHPLLEGEGGLIAVRDPLQHLTQARVCERCVLGLLVCV